MTGLEPATSRFSVGELTSELSQIIFVAMFSSSETISFYFLHFVSKLAFFITFLS